jgi:hypothetical protein
MAFETDSIEAETDASTTSFTTKDTDETYSEQSERNSSGVGTTPGDSADEVDPRRLMGNPSVNDLRWLYRTSLAQTLVNKPIDDAFKNGFDIKAEEGQNDYRSILDRTDWERHYKIVQQKARRDGFALTFFVLEDDSEGIWEDPMDESVNVRGLHKLEALTLDDLSRYKTGRPASGVRPTVEEATGREYDEYEIRRTGIVVDIDPTSPTYKEPLGYLIGPDQFAGNTDNVKFVHRNRIQHHVWNPQVDADLDSHTLGEYEGDSVLVSSYHILRGMKKANWSISQTLFRYAAKLYHVEMPEDADEDDFDEAQSQLQNMNAKGEIITPNGYNIQDFQTDGQLDPEPYFDVLFEQICASNEMTKSVLFGTQSGTVSGSETDIKNYFNKVERMRRNRIERDMVEFVTRYKALVDGRTGEDFDPQFEVEWGPLFRLSKLEEAERLSRMMGTVTAAINNFVMTPQEARSIMREEWAEADIDWQDDFSEEEQDFLKTLNIAQQGAETEAAKQKAMGQGARGPESGSPEQQNGGGMEQGQQTASSDPTSDTIDQIADAVAKRLAGRDEPRYEY